MNYNALKICLMLVVVGNLKPASSQNCLVDLTALQCGQEQPSQGSPSVSGLVQKIPGKRGPPGEKGEKGDSFDPTQLESLVQKVVTLETQYNTTVKLFRRQIRYIEALEERLDLSENQIQEMRTLVEDLTSNAGAQSSDISSLPKTCSDVPDDGRRENGSYVTIQPSESLPPFTVQCYFYSDKVVSSIAHNSMSTIEANGCEEPRCYSRKVDYAATIEQARSLITYVNNCRQFVQYNCLGSVMFEKGQGFAGWKTWDGRLMNYWGGADRQFGYCACGVSGTCERSTDYCNCDKNDSVDWREDSGYLSFESDLPLTEVLFGDLSGASEKGSHKIGPLECME